MPLRANRLRLALPVLLLILAAGVYTRFIKPDQPVQQTAILPVSETKPVVTYDEYGIEKDRYQVLDREVRRNETFAGILAEFGVPYERVLELVDASGDVFDARRLRAGQDFRAYSSNDDLQYLVYRQDPINYVVFDLTDEPRVEAGEREVTIVERTVNGVITNSLYQSLIDGGASPDLAVRLAEVYAWSIDFYRIQKNDKFEVLYEERQIDGEPIGTGKILAANFNHFGADYNAYYYEKEGDVMGDYYDEEGNSLRKAFLRAPLKYTRISSRYTQRRFHPIRKRYQPHLGTDYAAPTGTPIYAVGDGVVTEASYTGGNGNYVKIRHNSTYTTQYLHMSRHAKGISRGTRVKQGDVIGYVGQTGLATGPHLCYRFWKNGQQVDPYKEQLPAADPIPQELLAEFRQTRDALASRMSGGDREFYVQADVEERDADI